jgi:hypothetical protein
MQVIEDLLEIGSRPFSDHFDRPPVVEVADVSSQLQEPGTRVDELAEVDSLHVAVDKGPK